MTSFEHPPRMILTAAFLVAMASSAAHAQWAISEIASSPMEKTSSSASEDFWLTFSLKNISDDVVYIQGTEDGWPLIEAFVRKDDSAVWERDNSGVDQPLTMIAVQPGTAVSHRRRQAMSDVGKPMLLTFVSAFSKNDQHGSRILLGDFLIPGLPEREIASLGLAEATSLTASDPSPDFEVEAPLSRGGPQLTVKVISKPAISNWSYDLHVTTSDGLDQHLEIRNGQALELGDVRLADLNADGFLDLMAVGGKDHRGEPWLKTWLYHPKDKMFRWINEQ